VAGFEDDDDDEDEYEAPNHPSLANDDAGLEKA
jgi:hypothetical protein